MPALTVLCTGCGSGKGTESFQDEEPAVKLAGHDTYGIYVPATGAGFVGKK